MQRLPVVLLASTLVPAAYAAQHTTPANATETISAFTLNNTSASPVTVSISLTPAAGAPATADEIVTNLTVPAAGAAPTIVSALVGQHLAAGQSIQMKASVANVVAARISGYQTTQ